MATLTFSPPIIKLALLLILAVVGFAVTAWLIYKDVEGMADKAERAGLIRVTDEGKPGGDMTATVTGKKERDEMGRDRLRVLSVEYFEPDPLSIDPYPDPVARTRPVPKNKNKKRGPGKGNNYKGGGAR